MTWTPATQEPSVRDLSIVDAIRAAALPAEAIGSVRVDGSGALIVDRPGAPQLRAKFRVIDENSTTFGVRLARKILMEGQAVVESRSLFLSATAILDRVTGAFLNISFEILSETSSR